MGDWNKQNKTLIFQYFNATLILTATLQIEQTTLPFPPLHLSIEP